MSKSFKENISREIHLFIIWEKARYKEEEIISDISKKFFIKSVFEINWKKENFSQNLSRLYGENLRDISSKVLNCGVGPFLLIIVEDKEPVYLERQTLSG